MILTKAEQLKEQIVGLLAVRPGMSAEELKAELALHTRTFSRRAVFKELKALEELGVVVRTKGSYALQLVWLINMTSLFRNAYVSHLRSTTNGGRVPLSDRVKLTFTDLVRLDYAWMQVMVVLQNAYPEECTRVWKPEQWFHLVHEHITDNFISALGTIGTKQHHLIGHDCYPCRYGARQISRGFATVKFAPDPFGLGLNTYLTLIGDHLITVRLEAAFAQRMRRLFRSVNSKQEMLAPTLLETLRGRVESTLVVEYRPKRLNELRERFDRVFGSL